MGLFGDILIERIKLLGLTSLEVAKTAGVAYTTVSRARNMDEPDFYGDTLDRIASALGTTEQELRAEWHKRKQAYRDIDTAALMEYHKWASEPWQQTDECRRAFLAGARAALEAGLMCATIVAQLCLSGIT